MVTAGFHYFLGGFRSAILGVGHRSTAPKKRAM
jgi:hypothetical protein